MEAYALAAGSMQARLIFNVLAHQYLIPGVQIGSKTTSDETTGALDLVYSVVRPIVPGGSCLNCSGLISADRLQKEGCSPDERRHWRYGDDPDTPAPSVITLNAVGASHGADDFLFAMLGMTRDGAHADFFRYVPLERASARDVPRADEDCLQCGASPGARFALGDGMRLPVRMPRLSGFERISSVARGLWATALRGLGGAKSSLGRVLPLAVMLPPETEATVSKWGRVAVPGSKRR